MGEASVIDARLERWVRRLTPPASREEVLGDLAERCRTGRQYLAEALRTLPFVIGSRIRRTTHPLGVLVVGAHRPAYGVLVSSYGRARSWLPYSCCTRCA